VLHRENAWKVILIGGRALRRLPEHPSADCSAALLLHLRLSS